MIDHTPTPWRISANYPWRIETEDDDLICQTEAEVPKYRANAEFIVLAVNAHEALLEAARRAQACTTVVPNWQS